MAALIDRAVLLERIDAKFFATDPKGEEQLGYLNSRMLVRTAPTVDAVPVVRCKDCKHWMFEYDDVGLCAADVPDIDGVERTALNFCSIGERRTDADNRC